MSIKKKYADRRHAVSFITTGRNRFYILRVPFEIPKSPFAWNYCFTNTSHNNIGA